MDSNKLEEKLDKMHDDIVEIKVTMARNTASLEHHVERTAIAEENISIIRKEMEPIKAHVNKVEGGIAISSLVAKVLMGIATIAGTILGILRYFKH